MTGPMMTMRGLLVAVTLGLGSGLVLAAQGGAAQATVADLRLVQDESGTPLETVPSGPGEKIYHLEPGADTLFVGFDFTGSAPTDVEIRVMGPMGTVMYQETAQYDGPGPKVVKFDNGGVPLEDNEYVVNAYVGADRYLADSLQLTVGKAVLPTSISETGGQEGQAPEPTLVAPVSGSGEAQQADMPGPSRSLLMLAVAGMIALFGVVVWAAWSAMRRG